MARRMLSVLLAIVVAIIVIGFLLPREVVVQRSEVIDTRPDIAFAVLNNLTYFNEWSPWYARDPDAGYRLEGPAAGVGSTLVWAEAGDTSSGRLWITRSSPTEAIDLRLALGETETENFFRVQAVDGGVNEHAQVTWGMRMQFGVFDLTGRYVGLMLPSLVGSDYQRGLERLKRYLEDHDREMPPLPETVQPSDFPG